MAGENSPIARAKADAYAKQQAAQKRLQSLNAVKGAPVVKVGTKTQVLKKPGGPTKPLKTISTTTTTVSATQAYDTDPNAYIHKSFEKGGTGKQNPPFIYPGQFDRPVDKDKSRKIERGYIRRLTEFYDKQDPGVQGAVGLGKDSVSSVTNMKCNFQFNPDNITRMVTAESDMTFFFNQDPAQLAQPVPGKAGFSFELLFNREAEVASSVYLSKDGKQNPVVENLVNVDNTNPIGIAATWIGKPHEPEWVTKIGVLADILILDDVIGQGLAKDILDKIQSGATGPQGGKWGFDTTNSPGSPTTSTTSGSTTTKAIDGKRYDAYSMNMGNKAYLTPTPVRIMFTKWMMVEGFVQSVQVTFNKFSKNMIPTQASVMIQMQALYMGFAQQKTFLTDLPGIELGQVPAAPNTTPAPNTNESNRYKYYDDLLSKKSFFDKDDTVNEEQSKYKRPSKLPFSGLFRLDNVNVQFQTDKYTGIVKYGAEVLRQLRADKINYEIKWDGVLKVYWDSHAVTSTGSQISRGLQPGNAPAGYKYKPGAPPNATGPDTDFKLWGTASEPMVFTSIGNTGFPKVNGIGFGPSLNFLDNDVMHFSEDTDSNFNMNVHDWELKIRDKKPTETLRTSGDLRLPLDEDKFTYELGIRWYIYDEQYDFSVYFYDWHFRRQTEQVARFARYKNSSVDTTEWFQADLNAMDYRVKGTGAGSSVSGNGVTWFDTMRTYLGGTL